MVNVVSNPASHVPLVLNFNPYIAHKPALIAKSYRLIEPFQKGETPTFIEHVKAGLDALVQRPDSLLVFSGLDLRILLFKYRLFFFFSMMSGIFVWSGSKKKTTYQV